MEAALRAYALKPDFYNETLVLRSQETGIVLSGSVCREENLLRIQKDL